MKEKRNIIIFIVLVVTLTIISALFILINGRKYTIKINNTDGLSKRIEDINISFEKGNIVEVVEKRINDDKLEIVLSSLNRGKEYIVLNFNEETSYSDVIYVHKFGIITINTFFGDCKGDEIIPISISIILFTIIYILIKKYKYSIKESLYKYKNIRYIGLIVFLSVAFFDQLFSIKNYTGFEDTVAAMLGLTNTFSIIVFPVAFLTSIGVSISNLVLLKKEGKNWRNLLGLMLGLFFCIATIIPNILYFVLQQSSLIDVHNLSGIGPYIYTFIETTIYIIVAYLECILLGTIILSIKSAKKIPEFNKDFIIILGCKINMDGTLTMLLKNRVDAAIKFNKLQKEKTGKELIFIPSGGKGKDEIISEAEAMKKYLIDNGIEKEKIIIEDKSKSTYENIKNSNRIIKGKLKEAKIAIATTNYHVFRAGVIAQEQGISAEGLGAKTKAYFWINAFIREFIASLNIERKKHISIMLVLIIISALLIYFNYTSNII